ncbi:MAG: CHAD domain-containing protein [Spirulinaceae cyanobacterium]
MNNQSLSPKIAQTFGDWAYIALEQHYQTMLSHEAGVLQDEDPEELHQMRVGMRRLRTAIAGFAPALALPKTAQEKKVAKIARTLGKLRDLDVLQESLVNDYNPVLPPSEQKLLQKALKTLKKERKINVAEVKATLQGKTYRKLQAGFEDWFKSPQYQVLAAIQIDEVLPDLLLPQVSKLLLHPGWSIGVQIQEGKAIFRENLKPHEVNRLLSENDEPLHDLRKEAKRSRYQMELFEQFYGEHYQRYLKQIKKIQSVLGKIQDSVVLTEFLHRTLAQNLEDKMPILAEQWGRSRWQNWQDWQELQQKFLDPTLRQNLRQIMQYPHPKNPTPASHPDDSAAKSEPQPDQ